MFKGKEQENTLKRLETEISQNALLLSIAEYSKQELSILDFFSHFCDDVLRQCKWIAYAFDCFLNNEDDEAFRSDWCFSSTHSISEQLVEELRGHEAKTLLDDIAVSVIHNGEAISINNLLEITSSKLSRLLQVNSVCQVFAFPILTNRHSAGILYFLASHECDSDKSFIRIIETALEQLGLLIKYQTQHEALERNYSQLRNTVSELRETQSQLIQSEKLVSIGQLSAGIAHEINNPIGFIKNNLTCLGQYTHDIEDLFLKYRSLCEASSEIKPETINKILQEIKIYEEKHNIEYILGDVKDLVEESMQGILRVITITQGLNNFSRKSSESLSPCGINDCINEALTIASNELKYKIQLHESYRCDATVFANEGQIIQVILNIIMNAVQSITDTGDIYISTALDDNRVIIKIRDTGCGIPEQIIESIFNPFFTTKPIGDGTGLGLSISYGIIASHGGCITVDSEEGNGTEFMIWLPNIREVESNTNTLNA